MANCLSVPKRCGEPPQMAVACSQPSITSSDSWAEMQKHFIKDKFVVHQITCDSLICMGQMYAAKKKVFLGTLILKQRGWHLMLLVMTTQRSRPHLSHSLCSFWGVSTGVVLTSPKDQQDASPPTSFSLMTADQLSQVNAPWSNYLKTPRTIHVFSGVWSVSRNISVVSLLQSSASPSGSSGPGSLLWAHTRVRHILLYYIIVKD